MSDESGGCSVSVNAKTLGSVFGQTYSHLFILFKDASGNTQYLRGGPSGNGPGGSGVLGQLSGGSSNNSSQSGTRGSTSGASGSGSNPSNSGGGAGPYGTIATDVGDYEPGTIDWDPDAKSVEVASGPDVCGKIDDLKKQMELIQDSNTPYNPLGPNSNSTVYTALKNVGITPKVPDGVWAPGKDLPINVVQPPKQKLSSATMGCPYLS